ncbi:MAG: aminodeoxychorismate/anthranilate synthase component II [Gammaproteobacteria bacterium]|nr:aminodeoxychorismate/anthranilate synthase component II [Gammaproteobacteria bacterium]
MKILLVDAYDSFVHTIDQYLRTLGAQVDVIRNDQLDFDHIAVSSYSALVLGPGPGHPRDCGYVALIERFKGHLPIFGVCLGMQALALAFGGEVVCAKHRMHGKVSQIEHTGEGCFEGLPNPLSVTRYHSLIAEESHFPHSELAITARSLDDHYIMGVKHRVFQIEGVQFHPESICTDQGAQIFANFLLRIATPAEPRSVPVH